MYDKAQKAHDDIIRNLEKLTDNERLDCVELHDVWQPNREYAVGDYRKHRDLLYKCRQAHTSQTGWEPDAAPALWEEVSREDGTHDHPIHYHNNMALEETKFYTQNEVLYYCFRSTGQPVFNDLADLVGIYVEVSNE